MPSQHVVNFIGSRAFEQEIRDEVREAMDTEISEAVEEFLRDNPEPIFAL